MSQVNAVAFTDIRRAAWRDEDTAVNRAQWLRHQKTVLGAGHVIDYQAKSRTWPRRPEFRCVYCGYNTTGGVSMIPSCMT